jgi:hypothetical protein
MLHAVFKRLRGRKLVVQVDFAGSQEGRPVPSSQLQSNGATTTSGDGQTQHLQLKVIGTQSAMILDPPSIQIAAAQFSARTSWVRELGKHHPYHAALVCPDHDLQSCDCTGGCGLGHWDRADGKRTVHRPR